MYKKLYLYQQRQKQILKLKIMTTLKTLAQQIEKKTNSINRVKRDLKIVNSDILINDLQEFLQKLKSDRNVLQIELDKMYNKYN